MKLAHECIEGELNKIAVMARDGRKFTDIARKLLELVTQVNDMIADHVK